MRHKLLLLYSWFVRTLLIWLPDIPFIMRFRGWLYGLGMKSCGKNFQVAHSVDFKCLDQMVVGDNCLLGNGVIFLGSGKIIIEDEVLVGPHCVLASGNHAFLNGSYRYAHGKCSSIFLKFGCWIGANCTILPGAILPKGSVLAANSCLGSIKNQEDFPDYSLYAGNPARFIKSVI